MIAGLKPYAEMKESGVAWVGAVPAHWEVRRGKWLFRNRKVLNSSKAETNVLSLTLRGVVNNDPSDPEGLVPKDYGTYQLFRKEDLVFKLIDLENVRTSRVGLVHEDGIMSSAYVRLSRAHSGLQRYFFLQYYDLYQRGIFNQLGAGVRSTLGASDLLDLPIAVPPLDEQSAIVRFLDHADRRIRRAIAAKQKLIRLLEEQKRAIIHRAVTRGLDPDVRLKPSGVEWLGDVPEHWEIRAFSRCAIERADYRGATPAKTESGVFLVTARNVRKGMIDYQISKEYVAESDYAAVMRRGLPRIGDVLLTMEAPLGNVALVDREDVAFAQRVVRFRMDPEKLVPEFVLNSMLSPYFQDQLLSRGTGSTALGIKASKLPQLQILCPPVFEQNQILEHIDREVAPMGVAMDRARAEIELLREYRIRLVADVVTGKLDVRAAAAKLPAMIGPEESEFDDDENQDAPEDEVATEEQAA